MNSGGAPAKPKGRKKSTAKANALPSAESTWKPPAPKKAVKTPDQLIDEGAEDEKARSPNWTHAEKTCLYMAANGLKHVLREPYSHASGGNYKRNQAWQQVAGKFFPV